jgi:hypothetical protein
MVADLLVEGLQFAQEDEVLVVCNVQPQLEVTLTAHWHFEGHREHHSSLFEELQQG